MKVRCTFKKRCGIKMINKHGSSKIKLSKDCGLSIGNKNKFKIMLTNITKLIILKME